MARPISTSDSYRGGFNGGPAARLSHDDPATLPLEVIQELDSLRSENVQLRQLCGELEQALHEATSQMPDVNAFEERVREYEMLLEEKSETIRQLHQQLQDAQAALEEAQAQPAPRRQGPVPREEELLSLSEDLERERRQLQEDEATLMEQMRQMEMGMARERAEMARQRNDLQRLYGEIRHELERLERNGALQSKMDELKAKLQDASTRRGAAPATPPARGKSSANLPAAQSQATPPPPTDANRGGLFGRWFGGSSGSKGG